MGEGAPTLTKSLSSDDKDWGEKNAHDQPCYTYRSALGGQTRAQTKSQSLRSLCIIMSKALGKAYRSILKQHGLCGVGLAT